MTFFQEYAVRGSVVFIEIEGFIDVLPAGTFLFLGS